MQLFSTLSTLQRVRLRLVAPTLALLLSACSGFFTPWTPEVPPAPAPASSKGSAGRDGAEAVVPLSIFRQLDREEIRLAGEQPASTVPLPPRATVAPVTPGEPTAWLYASAPSQAYLASSGMDPSTSTRLWETFLRKYDFPYLRIATVEDLERVPANGVLVLPSVAVMSEREQQAVMAHLGRGGSVLSTWLTGVRSETGAWKGFDFMARAFDVRVAGNTEEDNNDNFLYLHGDSPIAFSTEAGLRVWLERIPNTAPLRLVGKYEAGQVMDWARDYSPLRRSGTIAYNERAEDKGLTSRTVTLGLPERVFLSMDAKVFEGLAHNVFSWLFRQPSAYVAAWPYPHKSAMLMAVESVEELTQDDVEFARDYESVGGRATYYVQSSNIKKSSRQIARLQDRGHDVAYYGDSGEALKGQSADVQSARLASMRTAIQDAGVTMAARTGFVAPQDGFDDTTRQLLADAKFDSLVVNLESSESRLPQLDKSSVNRRQAMVLLPRTQRGPEEYMTPTNDHDEAMLTFLREFNLSVQMGGLSVVRVGVRNRLTEEQRDAFFDYLNTRKAQIWMPSAARLSQWWRDRTALSARLVREPQGLMLKVTVQGAPVVENAAVWINLPRANARLRLQSPDPSNPLPPVGRIDPWRSAVVLQQLTPGEYCWYLSFDAPSVP